MRKSILIIAVALLLSIPVIVSAQVVPPHKFAGKAYINGRLASAGTEVEAFIDGQRVARAMVTDEGEYTLLVGQPSSGSRTITFRVNGRNTGETAVWTQGKIEYPFDLHSGNARPVADVFAPLISDGILMAVWKYDNATQSWRSFDPRPELASLNDLTEVGSGDVVWVSVSKDSDFQGGSLREGWNLIALR